METVAYGPIDRLYQVFTPEPPPAPEVMPAPASSKIKGWHFVAFVAGLGLVGFAIWKIKESKKVKKRLYQ